MKEIQITINNQIIPMQFTVETFKIYKKAFKKDFMSVIYLESFRRETNVLETLEHILQIMWSFAKTANPKTQRFEKWKKQLKDIPAMETLELFEEIKDQLLK